MTSSSPKTPLTELNTPHGTLFLKREDLSETGSHKFRYLADQMKKLQEAGEQRVVLSTTGNVGISASKYGSKLGMEVICLMSEKGDMNKASQIEKEGGKLYLSDRPVRWAGYLHKKHGIPLLKGSESDDAVDGYESLGREIIQQAPDADAIVNFCTSGTSSLGISQAYERSGRELPAFHLVQSGKSCSLVRELHPDSIREDEVDNGVGLSTTPRKEDLLNLIEESGGDAWYVSPTSLEQVQKLLNEHSIAVSWECQTTLLIGEKLLEDPFLNTVVVIISGKQWLADDGEPKSTIRSVEDADQLIINS